jgi:integrase
LEFTILTAARSGESRGVPWEGEIDKVWTVPPHRMKGEREHQVPLTALALAVVEYMWGVRQNDYVFLDALKLIAAKNNIKPTISISPWTHKAQGRFLDLATAIEQLLPLAMRSSTNEAEPND